MIRANAQRCQSKVFLSAEFFRSFERFKALEQDRFVLKNKLVFNRRRMNTFPSQDKHSPRKENYE